MTGAAAHTAQAAAGAGAVAKSIWSAACMGGMAGKTGTAGTVAQVVWRMTDPASAHAVRRTMGRTGLTTGMLQLVGGTTGMMRGARPGVCMTV
jgi:hypothetical protein